MALILRKLWDGYDTLFNTWSDPRTSSWFLIGSPFPIVAMMAFYLYFIKKLGPELMKNKQPFELKKVMIVFNIAQIVACFYVVYKAIALAWGTKYKWFCEPVDYKNTEEAMEIARLVYFYFVLKLIDLVDTIFFVLRKKQSHISFLHVYHHTGMVCLIWSAVKYLPGGHGTSLGVINSFVHVIMYAYYLLSLIDKKYQKSLWWKKHITQLQIFQFLILVLHYLCLVLIPNCDYPAWVAAFVVPQNLFMLILFIDFYIKTYVKNPKKDEKSIVDSSHRNGYSSSSINSDSKTKEQ